MESRAKWEEYLAKHPEEKMPAHLLPEKEKEAALADKSKEATGKKKKKTTKKTAAKKGKSSELSKSTNKEPEDDYKIDEDDPSFRICI